MKIDLIISADYIEENKIKDKIVVVIDMLRATSVITTALKNGAKCVIPILTVDGAFDKAKKLRDCGENVVLGGERRALKIEGFDFSNSPLEYAQNKVLNKTVILSTTNDTRALNLCKKADLILIGSMINGLAVSKKLLELNKDVVFVNAGTNGEFSMDDFICAGYMIDNILKEKYCEMSDIAKTAKYVYENNTDIISFIKNARHFDVLTSLGLQDDLNYCCSKNLTDIVPIFRNNNIDIL